MPTEMHTMQAVTRAARQRCANHLQVAAAEIADDVTIAALSSMATAVRELATMIGVDDRAIGRDLADVATQLRDVTAALIERDDAHG